MIKGVNRLIIEINDISNPFFEKVVCYVSPEYSGEKKSVLQSAAVNYVKIISADEGKSEKGCKKTLPVWVISIVSAVLGAAGTAICCAAV